MAGDRQRQTPSLMHWTRIVRTPGVQWINIQYGECAADLALLKQATGVDIREPPGLNIREDLDDLAALCVALDGVVGIQNATSVLAGACGAPVAFVTGPGSWFQLGQTYPPWFAKGVICATSHVADWTPAMSAAEVELKRMIARRGPDVRRAAPRQQRRDAAH